MDVRPHLMRFLGRRLPKAFKPQFPFEKDEVDLLFAPMERMRWKTL